MVWASLRFLPFAIVAESWVGDLRIAHFATSAPQHPTIAVVTLDESLMATLPYRSPIDRHFLSALVADVAAKGAASIGLDVLLDQPTEPQKDARLAETLQGLTIPVVIAGADAENGLSKRQITYLRGTWPGTRMASVKLLKNTTDQVVRQVPVRQTLFGEPTTGFAAALAEVAGATLPVADRVQFTLYGRPNDNPPPFAHIPALGVRFLPRGFFAGKIVLIGSDLGLEDRHLTPFDRAAGDGRGMAGVFIHAHGLAGFIATPHADIPNPLLSVFLLLVPAGLGVALALIRARLWIKLASLALCAIAAWGGAFSPLGANLVVVPLVGSTIALVAAFGLAISEQWGRERAQRRFIRSAFSQFLADSVVTQLEREPERLALGGERKELTFLFTDIAGFTTLAEGADPDDLTRLVNAYLDGTSAIVLAHGGTLDKFVGDALHVIFNAPLDQPDHRRRAVECALELDAFCQAFAAAPAAEGFPFGITRIGINTGSAIVGNFGGAARFDYTAHGDSINTAARLEGANKALGTRLCVSESTREGCDGLAFRPVARLILKGKTEAVRVYEPLADGAMAGDQLDAYAACWALLEKSAPSAAQALDDYVAAYPDDPVGSLHQRRLAAAETGTLMFMDSK